MTRIVAGTAGGRRLSVPAGRGTRPTSERAREGLFNTVGTLMDLSGRRVLDLFAGSGAVGLEALSRGAAQVLLVESDARAAALIRRNAAALQLTATVVNSRVERVLERPPEAPYDLAFLDPPYALSDDELQAVLDALVPWLGPDALIVVERDRRSPAPSWPEGIAAVKERSYGGTVLWYGRRS